MPELPEVETIRRTLIEHVSGLIITDVNLIWPSVVQSWRDKTFTELVTGRKIESLERRGKYLLFTLDEGWSLVMHMRMTGRLNYYSLEQVPERHTHLVFFLSQGQLHFSDVRKFGRIQVIPTDLRLTSSSLAKLGPEPLEPDFTAGLLGERLASKKLNIKAALLDQRVLAGLGNIYADEALFRAGVAPERKANSLSSEEILKLHSAIQKVLIAGISSQGTSFRDYRDANGEKGHFQALLQVYGRGTQPCLGCGKPLEKIRLAGRTTVFCNYCQC